MSGQSRSRLMTATTWFMYDGMRHMRWNCNRRFSGKPWRIAVGSMRAAGMGIGELYVSFQISEG